MNEKNKEAIHSDNLSKKNFLKGKFKNHKYDYITDVLVVGLGGAGGCAALEAHDAGAEVIIIEKQLESKHCSNTRMSAGGFHSPDPTGDKNAFYLTKRKIE